MPLVASAILNDFSKFILFSICYGCRYIILSSLMRQLKLINTKHLQSFLIRVGLTHRNEVT
ncbi:MAG: hypothetical protein Unbinned5350contig1004_33 [Prokaryotic dsDNA virus sp.]|nr:MAG: hypothetical protein Unbinned5350contig1004_33 [Prokaryotic dsDNA virus sp.]